MEGKERRTGRAGKRSSGGGRGKQMQATCHKDACPHTYTDTPTLSHEVVVYLNGERGRLAGCSSLLTPSPRG